MNLQQMQLSGERISHGPHLWAQSTMVEKPKKQKSEAARNSIYTQETKNEYCIGAPNRAPRRAPSLLSAFFAFQDALPRQWICPPIKWVFPHPLV